MAGDEFSRRSLQNRLRVVANANVMITEQVLVSDCFGKGLSGVGKKLIEGHA
jgi:hypothetical protein